MANVCCRLSKNTLVSQPMDLYCRSNHSTSANHGPPWVQTPPIDKCCRSSHSLPLKHSTNCGFITNHGSALLSKHSANHGFDGSTLLLKQRKSWIRIAIETQHKLWIHYKPWIRYKSWIRIAVETQHKPWIHYKSWIRIAIETQHKAITNHGFVTNYESTLPSKHSANHGSVLQSKRPSRSVNSYCRRIAWMRGRNVMSIKEEHSIML